MGKPPSGTTTTTTAAPTDARDVDAQAWNWRRYKQNRVALKGFRRALALIDEVIQGNRVFTRSRDTDLMSYRIVESLTELGALDVVSLGLTVEAEEAEQERQKRRERRHRAP